MNDKKRGTKKERAERVLYMREKVFRLTRDEFSQLTNIPYNSLQNWEQGRNKGLTEEGAERLIEAYHKSNVDCTIEWLMYGVGSQPRSTFVQSTKSYEEEIIDQELALFHKLNKNSIDMVVTDDSMSPCFWRGDVVAGKCLTKYDINKAIGHPCIIETNTGVILVRLLETANKSGRYNLICSNRNTLGKSVIENVEIKYAAPVLWLRRRNMG